MTETQQDEILSVDRTEEVEQALKLGEALQRLERNEDFKTLILDHYLNQSILNSVSLLGVPQIRDKGIRPNIMEDLVSASNLQYFFQMVRSSYESITSPILSDEEEAELAASGQEVH